MTRFDDDDLGRELRASLHRNADRAPDGELLAERIILAAESAAVPPVRRARRGWRTWGLPLVAAGSVAAVVAVVVAVASYHPSAERSGPAVTQHAPSPSARTVTVTQHATATPTAPTTVPTGSSTPSDLRSLHHVVVSDVTFIDDNDGWALGTADCLRGSGRCTALLRTTNGRDWSSVGNTPFNVGADCAYPCVGHIRFANTRVGYVFGHNALLMTTDGGGSWHRQTGGADSLETLDSNVIRISTRGDGCPGACYLTVQTAPLGATTWTTAVLPDFYGSAGAFGYGFAFTRAPGGDAYLLRLGHPGGGGTPAVSYLLRSTDDGRTWTPRGGTNYGVPAEPCPQVGGEVDSTAIAAGPQGRVAVMCLKRSSLSSNELSYFVATSTDGGRSFTARAGAVPSATVGLLSGDATTVLVSAADGLSRSTDGGRSWHLVASIDAHIGYVGFESPTVGRALAADGSTIWTTRNAGLTWTKASFS